MDGEDLGVSRYSVIRLLETFFRRWWLYLVPFVLLCALGAATVATKKAAYRSVGSVYVASGTVISKLTGNDPGFGYDTPAAATAKQMNSQLQTDQFVKDVATRTGLDPLLTSQVLTVSKIRSWITSYAVGPNLLNVVVTTEDPTAAQRLAQATIEAFIQGVVDANVGDSEAATTYLDGLVQTYQGDLDDARGVLVAYLKAHPQPAGFGVTRPDDQLADINRLNADVDAAQTRYNAAISKREDARLTTESTKADVGRRLRTVDAPQVPLAPQSGKKAMVLGFAVFAVMGVLLVLACVVVAAALDHSIRFPSDLTSRLRLAVFAVIPEAKPMRSSRRRKRTVADAEPARERLSPQSTRAGVARRPRERTVARNGTPVPAADRRPATARPNGTAPAPARRNGAPAGSAPQPPPVPPVRTRPAASERSVSVSAPVTTESLPVSSPAAREPAMPPPGGDASQDPRSWPRDRRPASLPGANGDDGPAAKGQGWPPGRRGGNIPHAS